MKSRKNYTSEFKAKVALEALKVEKSISQIASEFGVHPNMVLDGKPNSWKMLTKSSTTHPQKKKNFRNHRRTLQTNRAAESGKRFFIKKVRTTLTKKERLKMIERKALISIRRQCELLGVSRRTFYYKPKIENRGSCQENCV